MRMAVAVRPGGGGTLVPLGDDGVPTGPPEPCDDLVTTVAAHERSRAPRWVWSATGQVYPRLLAAGVRVARCHDLELVETLLLGYDGRYGEPRSLRAASARLRGEPVPADAPPADTSPGAKDRGQAALFDAALFDSSASGSSSSSGASSSGAGPDEDADPGEDLNAIVAVHADQLARMAAAQHRDRLPLLAAAESAGGLIAAEMSHDGLPWRADVHDALFTELLGPRPTHGRSGAAMRPRKLQALADRIAEAFGRPVNPDSPGQLVKAFAAEGFMVPSTRAHVLRQIDHPAVPILLEYKELARLYTAHGWNWLDTWVSGGRFRPEYVVGGVVSGRWATNGGGALQIPKVLRRAAVADPGWKLVVADAAQLEPRVLAALAGDRAFTDAAAQGDLYAALAHVFDGPATTRAQAGAPSPRDKAKIALLSAMYGGGTGEAVQLLGVLRQRFPAAYGYVENAAREGESGRLVRSRLGRTCPPPPGNWRELVSGDSARGAAAMRSRGRFTRNFVVQATAAEWALVLLATLRRRLNELPGGAHLVFFQHDEVIVHAPRALAEKVATAIRAAGEEAGRVLFGRTPVVFPLEIATVDRYADAK
jgi:DNA polymerase family A